MKNAIIFLGGFRGLSLMVIMVCCIAFMAAVACAEPEGNDMKVMKATQLTQVYDKMETQLLRRFAEQKKKESPSLSDTIKALGHIRSQKAVDLLMENIDIEPEVQSKRIGDFYPVSITKARTLESVYVALHALERIGVPLERCITELEDSKAESKREMLLAKLAYACHGKAFVDRANLRKKSDKTKWERVLKLSGEK